MPDDSQTYAFTTDDINEMFERADRLARGLPADPEDAEEDAGGEDDER